MKKANLSKGRDAKERVLVLTDLGWGNWSGDEEADPHKTAALPNLSSLVSAFFFIVIHRRSFTLVAVLSYKGTCCLINIVGTNHS